MPCVIWFLLNYEYIGHDNIKRYPWGSQAALSVCGYVSYPFCQHVNPSVWYYCIFEAWPRRIDTNSASSCLTCLCWCVSASSRVHTEDAGMSTRLPTVCLMISHDISQNILHNNLVSCSSFNIQPCMSPHPHSSSFSTPIKLIVVLPCLTAASYCHPHAGASLLWEYIE